MTSSCALRQEHASAHAHTFNMHTHPRTHPCSRARTQSYAHTHAKMKKSFKCNMEVVEAAHETTCGIISWLGSHMPSIGTEKQLQKSGSMERGSRWPLVSLYLSSFTFEVAVTRGDGWACETGMLWLSSRLL